VLRIVVMTPGAQEKGQHMTVKIDQFDAQLGIRTRVHETESKVVIEKTYDAEPLLKAAADMRADRAGERWDELGTHVGFIPMAELATMMRQDGGFDKKRVREYLQRNPAFVSFDKYLRTKG
jgi:hypothetical protein